MVCCTYILNHAEYRTCEDDEINELLQEVRHRTGEDWIVRPYSKTLRRFLRKPVVTPMYDLAKGTMPATSEYQLIMCASGERKSVVAYLIGMLTGMDHATRPHRARPRPATEAAAETGGAEGESDAE